MKGHASEGRNVLTGLGEVDGEALAAVGLAVGLQQERPWPALPFGHLGSQFRDDGAPNLSAGLPLADREAAFIHVGPAEPYDVRAPLSGIEV